MKIFLKRLWIIFIFPGGVIHECLHFLTILLFRMGYDFHWNLSFNEGKFKPRFGVKHKPTRARYKKDYHIKTRYRYMIISIVPILGFIVPLILSFVVGGYVFYGITLYMALSKTGFPSKTDFKTLKLAANKEKWTQYVKNIGVYKPEDFVDDTDEDKKIL